MLIHRNKIHMFSIATLNRFGFKTRAVLNNKSNEDCFINCYIRSSVGELLKKIDNVGMVLKNSAHPIDCEKLQDRNDDEFVFNFGIVPVSYNQNQEFIETNKTEMFKLMTPQDHMVEYHNEHQSFGVLHQNPPFNNKNISSSNSLILQAPKIFIGGKMNTIVLFHNNSSDIEYSNMAEMKCRLLNEDGRAVLKWKEVVAPNGVAYLDIKNILKGRNVEIDLKEKRFFNFQAVSKNATLIPLTIIENDGQFTMEHSMPPLNYDNTMLGQRKTNATNWLWENW